jgi:hypothetical protein
VEALVAKENAYVAPAAAANLANGAVLLAIEETANSNVYVLLE